jgi:hypothetical protein
MDYGGGLESVDAPAISQWKMNNHQCSITLYAASECRLLHKGARIFKHDQGRGYVSRRLGNESGTSEGCLSPYQRIQGLPAFRMRKLDSHKANDHAFGGEDFDRVGNMPGRSAGNSEIPDK